MDDVLRPLLVIGGSILLTLVTGWLIDRLLQAADRRDHSNPLWRLLRHCQLPLQVMLSTGVLSFSYDWAALHLDYDAVVKRLLALGTVVAAAWLAVRVASAMADASLARYAAATDDPARVRRLRTQLMLVRRVVTAVLAMVAAAVAMLLVFPSLKTLGASMLASAGIVGIIAGVAAQSMLGNLFAGLQIVFGDSVRIGDTVVVNGEWGTVEEISLAFITIRIWDDRRLTMPVSYFNSQPYENWSRGGPEVTGTVFLHLDHFAPVAELREKLHDYLRSRPEWDGRSWSLVVTDTTPTTIEVRAAMSARNPDDLWRLRCAVREELVTWLRDHHPYALPRVATAPAAVRMPAPREQQPRHEARS